ncbi:hypothetical protein HOD88_00020 [archaeon]|nr:hypothetical protein [archaeon]
MKKGLLSTLSTILLAGALSPSPATAQENPNETLCLNPAAVPERTVGQFKPLIAISEQDTIATITPDTTSTSYVDSTTQNLERLESVKLQDDIDARKAHFEDLSNGLFTIGPTAQPDSTQTQTAVAERDSLKNAILSKLSPDEIFHAVPTSTATPDTMATSYVDSTTAEADSTQIPNARTIQGRTQIRKALEENRNYIFSSDPTLSAAGNQGILLKNYVPMTVSTADTTNFNDSFYSNSGDLHFSFTTAKNTLEDALKRSAPDSSETGVAFRRQIRRFLKNQTPADSTSVAKLDAAVHEDGTLSPEDDLSNVVSGRYSLVVSNDTDTLPMLMQVDVPVYTDSTTATADSTTPVETSFVDASEYYRPIASIPDSTSTAPTDSTSSAPTDSTTARNNSKWYSFFGMNSDFQDAHSGEVSVGRDLGKGWRTGLFGRLNFGGENTTESSRTLPVHNELIGSGTYETRQTEQSITDTARNLYSAGLEVSKKISGGLAGYLKLGFSAKRMGDEIISTDRVTTTRNGTELDSYLLDPITSSIDETNYGTMVETGIELTRGRVALKAGVKNYDGETSASVSAGVNF